LSAYVRSRLTVRDVLGALRRDRPAQRRPRHQHRHAAPIGVGIGIGIEASGFDWVSF
jgi:hypothetical protein